MQTTLKGPVNFKGVGLHTGRPVRMTLKPAPAEFGVWFRRMDSTAATGSSRRAGIRSCRPRFAPRSPTTAGVSVMTIEHVMAAIAGCGLTNVLIEIDGPEVPILDGSAALFVEGILQPRAAGAGGAGAGAAASRDGGGAQRRGLRAA